MRRSVSAVFSLLLPCPVLKGNAAELAAGLHTGNPVDYGSLAFQSQPWKQKGVSLLLTPWSGTNVVFLTTNGVFDARLMSRWVGRLDQRWNLYADLLGSRPRLHKQLDGRATIAAVSAFEFTCGGGCGYLGSTGIELAMF